MKTYEVKWLSAKYSIVRAKNEEEALEKAFLIDREANLDPVVTEVK